MKALTCEMCGSTNLVKKDGVFVCQSCGTQYSVEEAKKMMVEGTVDVKGTVKVDNSDELKNLFEIARRAKDSGNYENAAKYYDMILAKDPQSWEANFYLYFGKLMTCQKEEIESCSVSLYKTFDFVFQLIGDEYKSQDEQKNIILELEKRLTEVQSDAWSRASKLIKVDDNFNAQGKEFYQAVTELNKILYQFGDCLEKYFGDNYSDVAVHLWKQAIKDDNFALNNKYVKLGRTYKEQEIKSRINAYIERIRKYEIDYKPDEGKQENTGGCYIATAVYGSYDCPQVWTLRRYRDYTLANTWYGRSFIRTYYAISPTLVKWFGHTRPFQSIGRNLLDKKVQQLNANGVENTRYYDK